MSDRVIKGTTVPQDWQDDLIKLIQQKHPTCQAILFAIKDPDKEGGKIEVLTNLPQDVLVGLLAEYVYGMAKELGMEDS